LKDPVQTGLEVQINTDKSPDLHGFGAIYDLVAPSKNASRGPGKWDAIEVRCKGPKITVTVNGEKVSSIDCDEWRDPGKRLEGTSTKFKMAVKDFPRTGYIGLQDHGNNVWFKNIKLLSSQRERLRLWLRSKTARVQASWRSRSRSLTQSE
jgi:hypothetical protein